MLLNNLQLRVHDRIHSRHVQLTQLVVVPGVKIRDRVMIQCTADSKTRSRQRIILAMGDSATKYEWSIDPGVVSTSGPEQSFISLLTG